VEALFIDPDRKLERAIAEKSADRGERVSVGADGVHAAQERSELGRNWSRQAQHSGPALRDGMRQRRIAVHVNAVELSPAGRHLVLDTTCESAVVPADRPPGHGFPDAIAVPPQPGSPGHPAADVRQRCLSQLPRPPAANGNRLDASGRRQRVASGAVSRKRRADAMPARRKRREQVPREVFPAASQHAEFGMQNQDVQRTLRADTSA
jgi:hypothetical protein